MNGHTAVSLRMSCGRFEKGAIGGAIGGMQWRLYSLQRLFLHCLYFSYKDGGCSFLHWLRMLARGGGRGVGPQRLLYLFAHIERLRDICLHLL